MNSETHDENRAHGYTTDIKKFVLCLHVKQRNFEPTYIQLRSHSPAGTVCWRIYIAYFPIRIF
jgi:hypothetical protein